MLNSLFHLNENHTTVKTELFASLTTFLTMAYIISSIRTSWPPPEWTRTLSLSPPV